jgi:hypothetical protein
VKEMEESKSELERKNNVLKAEMLSAETSIKRLEEVKQDLTEAETALTGRQKLVLLTEDRLVVAKKDLASVNAEVSDAGSRLNELLKRTGEK